MFPPLVGESSLHHLMRYKTPERFSETYVFDLCFSVRSFVIPPVDMGRWGCIFALLAVEPLYC